jgi:hypothetical protein
MYLNNNQRWVIEMKVKDMNVNQKWRALEILDMVFPTAQYTERRGEIERSLSRVKRVIHKPVQEELFDNQASKSKVPE